MIKKINEISEFNHFSDLSDQWWILNGKFKILHSILPLRIRYIKNNIHKFDKNNNKTTNPFQNLDILDLGCGGGLICEPLARLGAKVTGIDFIDNNIQVAKNHAKISKLNIKYLHQDLSSIKLKGNFDLILLLEVLEHFENWKNLIQKIVKYLKPNGKIIISTINRNIFSKIFALYISENILKWVPKHTHNYKKLIKPRELSEFFEKNQLQVTDFTGLVYNPISREWILKENNTKINYFCTVKKIN